MEQLLGLILLHFLIIFSFSFWSVRAIDCGGNQISKTITVDQFGKGQFTTIQSAIDSINQNNDRWVKIHINAGTYTEKVEIPTNKPCVFLEGDGKEVTTITYNDYSRDGDWKATFTSNPPNVLLSRITFKNSYNLEGGRENISQALAAAIYGDKCVLYECGFLSVQDTLFDASGRHYFKDCYIQGEADFIFGNGQSYYERCAINVTKLLESPGYITAQKRNSENETSGFVFKGGSVSGKGNASLGRAWGAYSRVIFHRTFFSSVVSPQGWDAWGYVGQESKLTYAEVNCWGAGADTSKRVRWEKKLTSLQLNEFSLSSFINKDGWLSHLPIPILQL